MDYFMAACIFSHLGEFSPVAIRVVEIITLAFQGMTSRQLFEDGVSLKRRTAQFRTEFKDALMCANASGFGQWPVVRVLATTLLLWVPTVVFRTGKCYIY